MTTTKGKNENFSDMIARSFPKNSLLELAGTLTNEEAAELREHIKMRRNVSRARLDRIRMAL